MAVDVSRTRSCRALAVVIDEVAGSAILRPVRRRLHVQGAAPVAASRCASVRSARGPAARGALAGAVLGARRFAAVGQLRGTPTIVPGLVPG
jgi:hypothetical protein